jgi:dGTPase
MNTRQKREELEKKVLSPYAAKSTDTLGRDWPVVPCELRTEYQRDRDRIIHCKSFRRLKYKTQVFLSPEGDHYRTRLTHTLEVSQIARTISRALFLNEDLTEAIALGHDLGILLAAYRRIGAGLRPCGWFQTQRAERSGGGELENDGDGLNLTKEVGTGS